MAGELVAALGVSQTLQAVGVLVAGAWLTTPSLGGVFSIIDLMCLRKTGNVVSARFCKYACQL